MTYEQRIALRILISEARRKQVAQAHQQREPVCEWCRNDFKLAAKKIAEQQRFCSQECRNAAAYYYAKRQRKTAA